MRFSPYKIVLAAGVLVLLIYFIREYHNNLWPQSKVPAVKNTDYHDKNYVHVCMAFDEHDILGTIAAINSIRLNSHHPIFFHLVTDEDSQIVLRPWLEKTDLQNITYEVAIFDARDLEGKIKFRGTRQELGNPMNYARYYYTELFPSLKGKALHIDSDVIVQGDVFDLASTSLKPGHIAAFSDDCTSSMKRFSGNDNTYASFLNYQHPDVEQLHMTPSTCSFNTGVYVFDVDQWRKSNMTAKLLNWLELNTREEIYGTGKAEGGSQPPMMITFYNSYSPMDPLWNLRHLGQNPKASYSEHFVLHGKLLHWNGPYKPWNGVAQFTKIWDKYYVSDPSGQHQPVRRIKQT